MDNLWSVIDHLYQVVTLRKKNGEPCSSYTAKLFSEGKVKIAKKLGEEAIEVALAIVSEDRSRVVHESADLIYHLLVALAESDVRPEDVLYELKRRFGSSGLKR